MQRLFRTGYLKAIQILTNLVRETDEIPRTCKPKWKLSPLLQVQELRKMLQEKKKKMWRQLAASAHLPQGIGRSRKEGISSQASGGARTHCAHISESTLWCSLCSLCYPPGVSCFRRDILPLSVPGEAECEASETMSSVCGSGRDWEIKYILEILKYLIRFCSFHVAERQTLGVLPERECKTSWP